MQGERRHEVLTPFSNRLIVLNRYLIFWCQLTELVWAGPVLQHEAILRQLLDEHRSVFVQVAVFHILLLSLFCRDKIS